MSDNQKYLIFGGSSHLGNYLIKNLNQRNIDVYATSNSNTQHLSDLRAAWCQCNVDSSGDLRRVRQFVGDISNTTVLYLPAFFNTHKSFSDYGNGWRVNVTAFSEILEIFQEAKRIYSFSTDMVFSDSKAEPYKENDDTKPLNKYGEQKLIQEKMALAWRRNIIRLPVMIGPSLNSMKPHFYDFVCEEFRKGHGVKFFADAYRSSITFDTAAKLILELNNLDEIPEILNIAADQSISKYEIGKLIAHTVGVDPKLAIPVSVDTDKQIWSEERPKKVLLSNKKLKDILKIKNIIFSFNKNETISYYNNSDT